MCQPPGGFSFHTVTSANTNELTQHRASDLLPPVSRLRPPASPSFAGLWYHMPTRRCRRVSLTLPTSGKWQMADDKDQDKLIERVRQGDKEALAAYVELRRPHLLGYIQNQLGAALRKKVEADDLFQEVSADAVKALGQVDLSQRDPFGWLCQIAQRRTVDAHRRFFGAAKRDAGREVRLGGSGGNSSQAGLIDMLVASMTSPSQAFSRDRRHERLREALAQLPDQQREALRLRYVEGLPSKEIAERLGKSDGAVRVMLTRSIGRLQELLGPQSTW